jgi:hypothetical protein
MYHSRPSFIYCINTGPIAAPGYKLSLEWSQKKKQGDTFVTHPLVLRRAQILSIKRSTSNLPFNPFPSLQFTQPTPPYTKPYTLGVRAESDVMYMYHVTSVFAILVLAASGSAAATPLVYVGFSS